jgi:hypothetical protein
MKANSTTAELRREVPADRIDLRTIEEPLTRRRLCQQPDLRPGGEQPVLDREREDALEQRQLPVDLRVANVGEALVLVLALAADDALGLPTSARAEQPPTLITLRLPRMP